MTRPYRNRTEAGARLAELVAADPPHDPVVLALPRGGVPVAVPVAAAHDAPLSVLLVRKIGLPGHPELGAGALAEDGTIIVDHGLLRRAGITEAELQPVIEAERAELTRRLATYRDSRPLPDLTNRDALLVDDGLARGVTAHVAVLAARSSGARTIHLAIPVGSADGVAELTKRCDRVICPWQPRRFGAVGQYYRDFAPVQDEEVRHILGLT